MSYLLGVEETQVRLTEELAEVCREYCGVTWAEALNLVRVPADSEWRQLEKVYYPTKIREVSVALPSPSATTPKFSEQPLTVQADLPLLEVLKGPSQASDQGQGAEGAKDKGKGKETKPPTEAKDDAKAKAQEIKDKTKEIDPKAKNVPSSKPSQKEDPPRPRSSSQDSSYIFFCYFVCCFCFCNDDLSLYITYSLFHLMETPFFLFLALLLYVP